MFMFIHIFIFMLIFRISYYQQHIFKQVNTVIEFKYKKMFQSKMTTRSGWGSQSSINTSCAPGFVPIPCPSHQQYSITNICKAPNCIQPLCPQCIANHVQLHQESKKPAKIQNIITTRTTCIEQLAKMKYDAQNDINECMANSSGNIQQFLDSHQRKIDIAYKKIIKIVDDLFTQMNKQMQVIASAYIAQKQKRQKQVRIKLTPIQQHITRITEYKQQLQSDDYIPALIQLLNEPPKKPKCEQISQPQNYGSVQINQKYLEDIKTDITKFIKVVVNCKDQGFKGRVEMNKSNFNGSNNMKFSRFDRSRSKEGDSKDGSQSKYGGESRRSNSKKKIFGGDSMVSDIKPVTGSNSRIDINNNSIYHGLNQNTGIKTKTQNRSIQQIIYSNSLSQIKIGKPSYFTNSQASLWYFKQGSKNVFKAPLQSIQAGFERNQLNINFFIPEHHRTVVLPNGTVFLIGGQISNGETTATRNKVHVLNEQDYSLREVQPMNHARSAFGVCYSHDYIYVAGGLFSQPNKWSNKKVLNQCQRYSLRQNRWQKICPLPEPAYQFSMHALSSGRILKFGGITQSRAFIHKIDIFDTQQNNWTSIQPDPHFILTTNPGITQTSPTCIAIFGGRIPSRNEKTSKCYIISQQQGNSNLIISQGPQLYNQATFESAYIHDGTILAIQNNQVNNRNKLIMGFKYNQWKFISC